MTGPAPEAVKQWPTEGRERERETFLPAPFISLLTPITNNKETGRRGAECSFCGSIFPPRSPAAADPRWWALEGRISAAGDEKMKVGP